MSTRMGKGAVQMAVHVVSNSNSHRVGRSLMAPHCIISCPSVVYVQVCMVPNAQKDTLKALYPKVQELIHLCVYVCVYSVARGIF